MQSKIYPKAKYQETPETKIEHIKGGNKNFLIYKENMEKESTKKVW